MHGGDVVLASVDHAQLFRLVLLLRLLSTQRDLSGHHALSLGDQRALRTGAVLPSTVPLVALWRDEI